MYDRLARGIAKHPIITIVAWAVIAIGGLAVAMVGVTGQGLFDRVISGPPAAVDSESARADAVIADGRQAGASMTLVLDGIDLADADQLTAAGQALAPATADLMAISGVRSVVNPLLAPGGPAHPAVASLLASDGQGFLIVVELEKGLTTDSETAALDQVEQHLTGALDQVRAAVPGCDGVIGGERLISREIIGQMEDDLAVGEIISLPIALVVMVVVFVGFLAAAMPLVAAIASIGAALGTLFLYSYLTEIHTSVINVVTVIGIGLSIDYGLLIVSRFREELTKSGARPMPTPPPPGPDGSRRRVRRPLLLLGSTRSLAMHGLPVESPSGGDRAHHKTAVTEPDAAPSDPTPPVGLPVVSRRTYVRALRTTLNTAGRAVTFSALTIAACVAGLMAFRPAILRTFGLAGFTVVLLALLTSLTLIPACLVLLAPRLAKPSPLARVPGLSRVLAVLSDYSTPSGFFSRLAAGVQRFWWLVLPAALAGLAVLASPVTDIQIRNSTIELLPTTASQRDFLAQLATNYPATATSPIVAVSHGDLAASQAWAAGLAEIPHIVKVDVAEQDGYIGVDVWIDDADTAGSVAKDVADAIRQSPADFEVEVTGAAARMIDFEHELVQGAPWAAAIVVVAAFVLLFFMTGSILIPATALVANTITLVTSLGVVTWLFQQGHLAGFFGFSPMPGIESYILVLLMIFGFGLAMDYECFLVSRIKEARDGGADPNEAVRLGLQRSGRIITSAALIIIVVFIGFAAGKLIIIKEIGIGLGFMVLIDATVVRMLLVPAIMTVLGKWNWWAPGPLRRLAERAGLQH